HVWLAVEGRCGFDRERSVSCLWPPKGGLVGASQTPTSPRGLGVKEPEPPTLPWGLCQFGDSSDLGVLDFRILLVGVLFHSGEEGAGAAEHSEVPRLGAVLSDRGAKRPQLHILPLRGVELPVGG